MRSVAVAQRSCVGAVNVVERVLMLPDVEQVLVSPGDGSVGVAVGVLAEGDVEHRGLVVDGGVGLSAGEAEAQQGGVDVVGDDDEFLIADHGVVQSAQGDEVVEVGGAAGRPGEDVVELDPAGVVASRHRAAVVPAGEKCLLLGAVDETGAASEVEDPSAGAVDLQGKEAVEDAAQKFGSGSTGLSGDAGVVVGVDDHIDLGSGSQLSGGAVRADDMEHGEEGTDEAGGDR